MLFLFFYSLCMKVTGSMGEEYVSLVLFALFALPAPLAQLLDSLAQTTLAQTKPSSRRYYL